MQKQYKIPKYPRVQVNEKRHALLAKEAAKEGVSMMNLVEAKLKLAEKVLKGLRAQEKAAVK